MTENKGLVGFVWDFDIHSQLDLYTYMPRKSPKAVYAGLEKGEWTIFQRLSLCWLDVRVTIWIWTWVNLYRAEKLP